MTPQTCAKFLTIIGYGFVIFGLVWVTTSFAGYDRPGRILLDVLHWPIDGVPSNPSVESRWMGGIGAGLTMGIGFFFAKVFAPIIALDDLKTGTIVRQGALIGLLAWFIVDGAGSVASGVPSNVAFNTIFFFAAVIPLWQVKFSG